MMAKLLLNELTLKPAGTLADEAAVVGEAEGAVVGEGEVVVAVVVAEVLFELLLHAAVSAASPTTAMPTNNRRDRR
jgi:hypothetical protein